MYPRIRNLREDNDWTQEKLAAVLHTSQATYSRYERGEQAIPLEVIIKLAELYQVSVDYLLERSDEK